jgi:hypothetical protein
MKPFYAFLSLVLLMVSASADTPKKDFPTQFYGSAENMNVIMTAEKVTACRLTAPRNANNNVDRSKLRDFKTLSHYKAEPAVEIPPALLTGLRTILRDPATNDPDAKKSCTPVYGVRFTFTNPHKTLTVNLCFDCDILVTAEADAVIGGGAFDPAADRLLAIAKSLFPNDKDLKSIE